MAMVCNTRPPLPCPLPCPLSCHLPCPLSRPLSRPLPTPSAPPQVGAYIMKSDWGQVRDTPITL
jgi:hypothetical protein